MSETEKPGGVLQRRAERAYARRLPLMRRVCRRMAAGATLAEACRDPMLPLAQEVCRWAAEEPAFAAMIAEARAAGGTSHLARPGRTGDWPEETVQEFLARIAAGRGLAEVCAEADMPTHTTIYRWLKTRPAFAAGYREARDMQADLLFDLAWLIARQATEETVRVSKLMVETLKWRCARLAPRVYGTARAADAGGGADAPPGRPLEIEIRRFEKTEDGKGLREIFPDPPQLYPFHRTPPDRNPR